MLHFSGVLKPKILEIINMTQICNGFKAVKKWFAS